MVFNITPAFAERRCYLARLLVACLTLHSGGKSNRVESFRQTQSLRSWSDVEQSNQLFSESPEYHDETALLQTAADSPEVQAKWLKLSKNIKSRKGGYSRIDMSPLFKMDTYANETDLMYRNEHGRFKCCCKHDKCKIRSLDDKNSCDSFYNPRDRTGCGCLAGLGYQQFHKAKDGQCNFAIQDALRQPLWGQLGTSEDELTKKVEKARHTRIVDAYKASYGDCNTTCGHGHRPLVSTTRMAGTATLSMADARKRIAGSLKCSASSGCRWECKPAPTCGWGTPLCKDADGKSGTECDIRHMTDSSIQGYWSFLKQECYKSCPKSDGLSTICTVAVNHLDEQYSTVQNLVAKTCYSNAMYAQKPDLIVLLTQELNHAGKLNTTKAKAGHSNFDKYINGSALPGYELAAQCNDAMSAGVGVFVTLEMRSRVLRGSKTCSGVKYRSACDWTNCKGTAVLGVKTTSGMLVAASMHLARGPRLSEKRVEELTDALRAVTEAPAFRGRKIVVLGGDINVRSDFGTDDAYSSAFKLNPEEEHTAEAVDAARGLDVLGIEGVTLNDHLRGESLKSSGMSKSLTSWMQKLKELKMQQFKNWRRLCPTYRKTSTRYTLEKEEYSTGEYEKAIFGAVKQIEKKTTRIVKRHSLLCKTPAEQTAQSSSEPEYLSLDRMGGSKSRAPSWTMRIMMSGNLHSSCGSAMKDTRHQKSDHDPVFVKCSMSHLSPVSDRRSEVVPKEKVNDRRALKRVIGSAKRSDRRSDATPLPHKKKRKSNKTIEKTK